MYLDRQGQPTQLVGSGWMQGFMKYGRIEEKWNTNI